MTTRRFWGSWRPATQRHSLFCVFCFNVKESMRSVAHEAVWLSWILKGGGVCVALACCMRGDCIRHDMRHAQHQLLRLAGVSCTHGNMAMSIKVITIFAVPAAKWDTPNNATARAHQCSGATWMLRQRAGHSRPVHVRSWLAAAR